jgi:hypothetical protein
VVPFFRRWKCSSAAVAQIGLSLLPYVFSSPADAAAAGVTMSDEVEDDENLDNRPHSVG